MIYNEPKIERDSLYSRRYTTDFWWIKLPPSVNNLYINAGKKRVRSKKYKDWFNSVNPINFEYINPAQFPIKGKVKVDYFLERPNDKRKRDIANYEKALSDNLVKHGIIEDDSLIQEISIKWVDDDDFDEMKKIAHERYASLSELFYGKKYDQVLPNCKVLANVYWWSEE